MKFSVPNYSYPLPDSIQFNIFFSLFPRSISSSGIGRQVMWHCFYFFFSYFDEHFFITFFFFFFSDRAPFLGGDSIKWKLKLFNWIKNLMEKRYDYPKIRIFWQSSTGSQKSVMIFSHFMCRALKPSFTRVCLSHTNLFSSLFQWVK